MVVERHFHPKCRAVLQRRRHELPVAGGFPGQCPGGHTVAAATITSRGQTNSVVTFRHMTENGKLSGQAVEGQGFFSSFGFGFGF